MSSRSPVNIEFAPAMNIMACQSIRHWKRADWGRGVKHVAEPCAALDHMYVSGNYASEDGTIFLLRGRRGRNHCRCLESSTPGPLSTRNEAYSRDIQLRRTRIQMDNILPPESLHPRNQGADGPIWGHRKKLRACPQRESNVTWCLDGGQKRPNRAKMLII